MSYFTAGAYDHVYFLPLRNLYKVISKFPKLFISSAKIKKFHNS